MEKLMVLWIACIVVVILAAGCATMRLSPEDRELAREFDKISLTAYDIDSIKKMGFNPAHLSAKDKLKVMEESGKVSPWIIP